MEVLTEQIIIYGAAAVFCILVVYLYVRKGRRSSRVTREKVDLAKEEGRFEPVSLHPYIDLNACIGSAACIRACPEKDILGLIDGQATVINATNCVGHGACFHACPVEAISLRIGTEKRGVDLPHVNQSFETNMKGIYIAGELGGMGLIKNSVEQGRQAVENIVKSKKPSKEDILDLVIVGAGPAGISGALTARKHNLNCLTLEQDTLGGTVFTFPRAKVVMTRPVELPLYGKVKLHDTSKSELLKIWQEALEKNKIELEENSKVEKITPLEDGTFRVTTANGIEYLTNHVLVAIGRRGSPRKLSIPGEESEKVAYRLLEPERIEGKKILVVGGGDSAVESAMLLMDQNEVSISYRKDNFGRIKAKNRERIAEAIQSGKITPYFNSNLVEIQNDKIIINVDNPESIALKNDLVYIFIGGELPIDFLMNAGIKITKKFGQIMKSH